MLTTLFTDVNCPFCYATEIRLEALGVMDQVQWRGVEHEPGLPVPMRLDDEEIAAEMAEEVTSVRDRAPEVPIALPPGKANSGLALATAVAATRVDEEQGRKLRHELYSAFWRDGQDVSDPAVVESVVAGAGMAGLEVLPEDELRVASWRLEWERSPLHGIPLLVRPDAATVYGLKDSDVLQKFVAGA